MLKFRQIGNKDFIEVHVVGEDRNDDRCEITEQMTVHELLKMTAEIIDKSPYYKDIFDSRLF